MTTTTAPIQTATGKLEISDLALTKADAITVSELLESDLVADTVIRSICIIRKTLLSKDISHKEDQQLEAKLTALYHALGHDNRDLAHQIQRDRLNQMGATTAVITNRPVPQPLPPAPRAAAKLSLVPAVAHATEVLQVWQRQGKRSIGNAELRNEIAKLHLVGGLQWHSTDLIQFDPDTRQWHKTVALAMDKLVKNEQVMWSAKRDCWVILDF
jgi:hypothetical protein